MVLPVGSLRTKPHLLLRALLETGRDYACALCRNPGVWEGRRLVLQIDHQDGDFHNNRRENLRLLCPNCHSQTPHFAGRSRGRFDVAIVSGTPGTPGTQQPVSAPHP